MSARNWIEGTHTSQKVTQASIMSGTRRRQLSALEGSRRQMIFSNIICIIPTKKENKTQRLVE